MVTRERIRQSDEAVAPFRLIISSVPGAWLRQDYGPDHRDEQAACLGRSGGGRDAALLCDK